MSGSPTRSSACIRTTAARGPTATPPRSPAPSSGSPAVRRDHWTTCSARSRRARTTEAGGSEMGESASRTRADAVITVHKYEPSAYDEPAGGPVLTRIHVEESFSGDISGDGV